MMSTIDTLKLALEALETERENYRDWDDEDGAPEYIHDAITAIKQALAAPAQEPVAQAWAEGYRAGIDDERMSEANIGIAGFDAKVEPARNNPYRTNPTAAQPAPVAKPHEQEPIAYLHQCGKKPELKELSFKKNEPLLAAKGYKAIPLTSPPAQRKPLTDEQAHQILLDMAKHIETFGPEDITEQQLSAECVRFICQRVAAHGITKGQPILEQALAAPVQEPVAWVEPEFWSYLKRHNCGTAYRLPEGERQPLYTTPPAAPVQRPSFKEWTTDHVRCNIHKLKAQPAPVQNTQSSIESAASKAVNYRTDYQKPLTVRLQQLTDRYDAMKEELGAIKSEHKCQTCEALARTVMMDQTSHDTHTASPAPEERSSAWVGLTTEERIELYMKHENHLGVLTKAIEAKLKEKNK